MLLLISLMLSNIWMHKSNAAIFTVRVLTNMHLLQIKLLVKTKKE